MNKLIYVLKNGLTILRQIELFGGGTSGDDSKAIEWKAEDVQANMATALFETEKQMFDCITKLPEDWVVDAYTPSWLYKRNSC